MNRWWLCLSMAAALLPAACAIDPGNAPPAAAAPASIMSAAPAPATGAGLVPFASEEGMARLARARAKVDFAPLANQFEPQSNAAFCGPTSSAIVLNALRSGAKDLPRDHSRLSPDDVKNIPPTFDLAVPRYTQENVIGVGQKTRAQVLGEPMMFNGKLIRDGGYQLRQLDQMLRAHDLATRLEIVDDARPEAQVRADIVTNLQRPGTYVLINYRREAVGQRGGAHISPLGAYDADTDSVLVLDVNPTSAGWVWMPMATMVKGMRTFDTAENRGYIVVQDQRAARR